MVTNFEINSHAKRILIMEKINSFTTKEEVINYVKEFDVVAYKNTRNHLSGIVSRLSPFITRGVISLPEIRDIILERYSYKQAEKFIQELAWREYWQEVWFAKGDDIFTDLRFSRDDWEHDKLVEAIVLANTGIKSIDIQIEEMYQSGYMHNHARMWTAMLACNVAKAHWYNMSRWMYYHLFDGDLASNMLSWQWVAGTNAGKRYVAHQKLINACSDTSQIRTYLTMSREEVGIGETPSQLKLTMNFDYITNYPNSDEINWNSKVVFLYSPWTLDPEWCNDEEGERVLIFEPCLFDRFPVSEKVIEFIVTVAKTQVPDIKLHIGNIRDVHFGESTTVKSKLYPSTKHWPGHRDIPEKLFPNVAGYYPSFFKYWKECTK